MAYHVQRQRYNVKSKLQFDMSNFKTEFTIVHGGALNKWIVKFIEILIENYK